MQYSIRVKQRAHITAPPGAARLGRIICRIKIPATGICQDARASVGAKRFLIQSANPCPPTTSTILNTTEHI
jgi:hypothetical protein